MKIAEFDIELLTPVAIPARSRTLDDAGSRRYIPGGLLLGCAAKRLYRELQPDDAFRVFQTAAVRFGDGLPIALGARSIPMPKSLSRPKHAATGLATIYNLVSSEARDDLTQRAHRGEPVQLEPFEAGKFVSADLASFADFDGRTELTLRTSVSDSGRAADGLLFTLDLLPAGLVFRARVSAREEADLEKVAEALVGDRHRIGRSRTAELGRVRITRGEASGAKAPVPASRRLSYLCVSSVALRDPATGMPTFTPEPTQFGLPTDWRLDLSATFIRSERFSPFHGTRQLPDLERQLIERGSVLTFAGDSPCDAEAVAARVARGVGEHRGAGHGELLVMAGALLEPFPARPGEPPVARPPSAPRPDDELFAWAARAQSKRAALQEVFEQARDGAVVAAKWRVPPAQWGQVRALARECRVVGYDDDVFVGRLKSHVTTGVAKLNRLWGRAVRRNGATASAELLALVASRASDKAAFVEQLSELVVPRMRAKEQR